MRKSNKGPNKYQKATKLTQLGPMPVEVSTVAEEGKELSRLAHEGSTVVTTVKEPVVTKTQYEFFETDPNPGDPGYSSTIAGARFDPKTGLLQIVFKDRKNPEQGKLYNYDGDRLDNIVVPDGVPMDIWVGFKAAGSKGSYFHAMIEKRFKGVKQQ